MFGRIERLDIIAGPRIGDVEGVKNSKKNHARRLKPPVGSPRNHASNTEGSIAFIVAAMTPRSRGSCLSTNRRCATMVLSMEYWRG
jgi:hypothetical protein